MTDLYFRAARLFGSTDDAVHWPYGMGSPERSIRRTDPERYEGLIPPHQPRAGGAASRMRTVCWPCWPRWRGRCAPVR